MTPEDDAKRMPGPGADAADEKGVELAEPQASAPPAMDDDTPSMRGELEALARERDELKDQLLRRDRKSVV